MEVLSHGRLSLEYSEDTAHTVEVIREENEHGELGSFGFTLLYEKPPIVGTIVPGGPAEKAGLRKQDVVIAVNGQDITHFTHQEVVGLIYNTPSSGVWLLVCEPSIPQKNQYIYGRPPQGGLGSFLSQSSPIIPRNVMDPSRRPMFTKESPPGYSEMNRYPNPGMGGGYSLGGRAITSSAAVISSNMSPLKRRALQQSMGSNGQSAQNGIDGGVYVKSSQQQILNSAYTSASVMVLYIGPVEIPEIWSSRGLSAKCIQECTRRLLSQRQEFIEVFLEITLSSMKVLNVSRNTLVKHRRDELYYCGACTDDEQYFAVVTRKLDQKSSHKLVIDPEVGQTVPSEVGKASRAHICHVFRVIQSKSVLVLHSEDKKGKQPAPDIKSKTIPIQSCITLISAIRGLFMGSILDDYPSNSGSNQSLKVPSTTSFFSTGSSGSNGSNEYESPYGSPDKSPHSRRKKYDVVDLRPMTARMSPPSSHTGSAPGNMYVPEPVRGQIPFPHPMSTPAFRTTESGGKTWYSTSSPKENHSRGGSWDNRDPRSRPNSGNFANFRIDGDFGGGGVYLGAGGGSGGHMNTVGGGTRVISAPQQDQMARKVSDESSLSSLSSSRTASPAKLSFRSSYASRSRTPSPVRSLSYSSGSRSRSPSPGKGRSPPHVTPSRFANGAAKLDGLALEYYVSRNGAMSPVSAVSSMWGSRVGLRRQGSESSIMDMQAMEQMNSPHGTPYHRGGLPQKNGPISSSIGSVATLTTVADEDCDEPENLGRVGSWVASFDKLLADPLGVQCLLQFLEKEHCEENIMFWRDAEEFKQKSAQIQNLQQGVKRIYEQYLSPSAPHSINIDDRVQKAVESGLANPPLNIFNEAQDHIYRLMKMDCYPRFKKSDLVKDCLLAEVEGRTLPIETAPERKPKETQYGVWKKQRSSIFSRWGRGARTQQSFGKGGWAPTTGAPAAEGGKSKGSWRDGKGSGKREDPKKTQGRNAKAAAAEESSKPDVFPPENHLEFLKAHKGNIFEVNLPNKVTKIMEVPAKGLVRDAIRPVLKKHGYSFDIMELRFANTFKPVEMESPASILIGQHIIVIKSKNTFIAVFPDIPEKILPADGKKSVGGLFTNVLRDLGKAQNFAVYMEGSRVPLELSTDTSILVGQRVVLKYLGPPSSSAPPAKTAAGSSPGLASKDSKSSLNSSGGSNKDGDVDDLISMICRLTNDTLGDQRTSPTPSTPSNTPEPGNYLDTAPKSGSQGSSNEGEQQQQKEEKSHSRHNRTRSQGGPKSHSSSPNLDPRLLNVSPSSGSGVSSHSGHGHSPSGGSKSKRRSAHDKKTMTVSKSSDQLVETEELDYQQQVRHGQSLRPSAGARGNPALYKVSKSAFHRTQSGVTISSTAKPEPTPRRSFSPPGNVSQRGISPPVPTSRPPPLPTGAVQQRTSDDKRKASSSARLSGVSIKSIDSGSSADSLTAIMSNDPRLQYQKNLASSDYPYTRGGRSHTVGTSEAPQFFPGAFPSIDSGHRRLGPTISTPMYANSSAVGQENKVRSSSMSYQRNRPANLSNMSSPLVGEANHPLDSVVNQAYSNAPSSTSGSTHHQRQHSCPARQVDFSPAGHPLQTSVRGGGVPGSGATLSNYPWHQAQRRPPQQQHQQHRTAAERMKLTQNPELLQKGDRLVQKEIEEFRSGSESSTSDQMRTPLSPTTHMLVVPEDDDSTVNQRETFV